MGRGWVAMARDDVVETMDRWHAIKAQRRAANAEPTPTIPYLESPISLDDATVVEMIDKLLGSVIMLLRAVEEVESRPWWRRRRFNPYAR